MMPDPDWTPEPLRMPPFSRRDQAALVAGLECLRLFCVGGGAATDEYATLSIDGASRAIDVVGTGTVGEWTTWALQRTRHGEPASAPPRLLRARLALLLRVLLRADAGDFGPAGRWHCPSCGPGARPWIEEPPPRCTWCGKPCRRSRAIRPLWERAPAHDPAITPRQRREGGKP